MRPMIRRDGGVAWVSEARVEEYLAAGYRLPDPPAKKRRVSGTDTRKARQKE